MAKIRTGRRWSSLLSLLWLATVLLAGLGALTFTAGSGHPRSPSALRHAERGIASSGIQGEDKFDGILDELAAAAQAEEEAQEPVEELEEDSWAWLKESFGWVLVADVFILIARLGTRK
ncbi:MDH2 [Symbiodinium natans]|uniref:MDH2 protein n=1 Tax=Symbiodinium natans TaxID=878477 RepID=A0A812V703_9DINO|nr:MDH2 [Symbiodinium natans]